MSKYMENAELVMKFFDKNGWGPYNMIDDGCAARFFGEICGFDDSMVCASLSQSKACTTVFEHIIVSKTTQNVSPTYVPRTLCVAYAGSGGGGYSVGTPSI